MTSLINWIGFLIKRLFSNKPQTSINKSQSAIKTGGDINAGGDVVGGNKIENHYHTPSEKSPDSPKVDSSSSVQNHHSNQLKKHNRRIINKYKRQDNLKVQRCLEDGIKEQRKKIYLIDERKRINEKKGNYHHINKYTLEQLGFSIGEAPVDDDKCFSKEDYEMGEKIEIYKINKTGEMEREQIHKKWYYNPLFLVLLSAFLTFALGAFGYFVFGIGKSPQSSTAVPRQNSLKQESATSTKPSLDSSTSTDSGNMTIDNPQNAIITKDQVGDNLMINTEKLARHVNKEFITGLNKILPEDKNRKISLKVLQYDQEAKDFALEIKSYIESQDWKNVGEIEPINSSPYLHSDGIIGYHDWEDNFSIYIGPKN